MRTSPEPNRAPSRADSLELVVFLGNETRVFPLPEKGIVRIGRAPESDVRIDDASISRRQAILHVDDELSVEDLGSANGTSVRRQDSKAGADTERIATVAQWAYLHRQDSIEEIAKGTFRAGLFYRINGVSLQIPPLRERRADIPAIAEALLDAVCRRLDRAQVPGLSRDVLRVFERYDWPGNVRELRNVMDRVAVFCEESVVRVEHLPKTMVEGQGSDRPSVPVKPVSVTHPDALPVIDVQAPVAPDEFRSVVEDLDRRRVLDALATCGGNQTRAAEMLGMSRRTLVARLDAYGLPRPRKGT